jgi:hypothetical protein
MFIVFSFENPQAVYVASHGVETPSLVGIFAPFAGFPRNSRTA